MTTVSVPNKFSNVLAAFGDIQESVNAAVQRYAIAQPIQRPREKMARKQYYSGKLSEL